MHSAIAVIVSGGQSATEGPLDFPLEKDFLKWKIVLPNATTKAVLYCTELSLDLRKIKPYEFSEGTSTKNKANLHFV